MGRGTTRTPQVFAKGGDRTMRPLPPPRDDFLFCQQGVELARLPKVLIKHTTTQKYQHDQHIVILIPHRLLVYQVVGLDWKIGAKLLVRLFYSKLGGRHENWGRFLWQIPATVF